MKNLLKKEFLLALHPTAVIFAFFGVMTLIPNYPYEMIFFFGCLSIFFISLTARENQDLEFSALLPVTKGQIVRARITMCAVVQAAQFALAIPFVILKNTVAYVPNAAGMDANTSLIGLSLIMVGLFNITFFPIYFSNPEKVGKAFIFGCLSLFSFFIIIETLCFATPLFREVLDTRDPAFMGYKSIILVSGAVIYCALSIIACKISEKKFDKYDI